MASTGRSLAARAGQKRVQWTLNGRGRFATNAYIKKSHFSLSNGGARPKSGGRLLDGETWDGFPIEKLNGSVTELFG